MISDDSFEKLIVGMRPKLHRYCARMTGSAIDGEDVVQEALIKAVSARSAVAEIDNVEGWLFRIAHNASLDFLRSRSRGNVVPITDEMESSMDSDPDIASVSFRRFLELPVLQRCAVVLKDVLGYSVEEIAGVADCSVPAAKSALQRARERLKRLAAEGEDAPRLPPLTHHERRRLQDFVAAFKAGDFDTIRKMLADDVRLDLVNRINLEGRKAVDPYFARYAEAGHWRFALGAVDGRAAMLVYDSRGPMDLPAHFVVVEWRADEVAEIRDFLFAPYAMEACDWVLFDPR